MKVKEIMCRDVATCLPDSPLNEAARVMWERDCGFVPVVEPEDGKLRGVITDRDICMAAYIRDRPLSELRVADVMCSTPKTCRDEDELSIAGGAMGKHQVRRLPVTDRTGALVGVVTLNDLALTAAERGDKNMRVSVAQTLAEVGRHRAGALSA